MSQEAQFFEGASIVKNDLVSSLAAVCRKLTIFSACWFLGINR